MKIFSSPVPAALLVVGLGLSAVSAQEATVPPAETGGAPGAEGEDFLPKPFRADRHASTWSNSPFTREVLPPPAGPTGPQGPAPWDGWKIAAVDKFGGEYSVGLVSKKNEFMLLKVGQTHEDSGVTVTKVDGSGVITDTVVYVTDGTRQGEIEFDTKRLVAAPKGAPKPATNNRPPQQNRPAPKPTPQQAAAAAAAKQRAAAELTAHLQKSVAPGNSGARPAGQTGTAGSRPAAGSSTDRVKRRSVVLPPPSNR